MCVFGIEIVLLLSRVVLGFVVFLMPESSCYKAYFGGKYGENSVLERA